MATILACGATPAIPTPFTGAAIVDATCVPWPPRSWTAALFAQFPFPSSCGSAVGVVSKMNEHELATSRFGAISGWVMSTPPSITPTRTPRPVATAYEPPVVALIWSMSHWHAARGSADGTLPRMTGASRLLHSAAALVGVSAGEAAGTR